MEAAPLAIQQPHSTYQRLDSTRKQIRLVSIQPSTDPNSALNCHLETVSLLDKPEYEALSYCWGDPANTEEISIDDRRVHTTANLFAALRQFRKNGEASRLWIDAICINQADLQERSQQVALMRDIYQQAANVRIWLGPSSNSTAREFDLVRRLLQEDIPALNPTIWQSAKEFYQQTPDTAHDWFDLVRFLRNRYWHRTWTIQERVLASSLTLQSGCYTINIKSIRTLIAKVTFFFSYCNEQLTTLANQETEPFATERVERLEAFKMESRIFIPILGSHLIYRFSDENNVPIPSLLGYVGRTEVTDPKDHVYGKLGLFPEIEIVPDYNKSLKEVYTDFAIQLMRCDKSFTVLYLPSPPESALPSWLPDLRSEIPPSVPYPLEGYFKTEKLFDASLKTTFRLSISSDEALLVPALILDCIAPLPPRYRTPFSQPLFSGVQDLLDTSFLKTRCLGVAPTETIDQLRPLNDQDMRIYKAIWRGLFTGQQLPEAFALYFKHFDNLRDIHVPFYTAGGRFGCAQTQVEWRVGDSIVVLASLGLPLVVRWLRGREGWRVIGACYLNDVMFGEAVRDAAGDEGRKDKVFEEMRLV